MNLSCWRVTVLSLFLLASGLAGQDAKVTFTKQIYSAERVCYLGEERWLTTRVVDGITGAPIAGAELLLVAESNHPMRGEFWWQMRAVADADGFVNVRADERAPGYQHWGWIVVRAPGYGPTTNMRCTENSIVHLAPAVAMPIRVVDWLDRPAVDALVGFCGGCGHTPDIAHARTDANGLALLAGVDPHNDIADLYVEHPDLGLGYEQLRWFPGQAPAVFRIEPGVTSIGVVVDAAGKGVAGAFVGGGGVHRGPWTRTDASGAFRLYGSDDEVDPNVWHGQHHVIFERPREQPFRLQLPTPNGEKTQVVNLTSTGPTAGDGERVNLSIVDSSGQALSGARFQFFGPLPKRTEVKGGIDDREGDTHVWLQPGSHEVMFLGDDHATTQQVIVVRAGGENVFELRPTPLPTMHVHVDNRMQTVDVELRTASARRDISQQVLQGRAIGLPDEPFWLFLTSEQPDQRRLFAYERGQVQPGASLQLSWFQATRITGRLVDAEGDPVQSSLSVLAVGNGVPGFDRIDDAPTVETSGAFTLTTELEGLAFVIVGGADETERVMPVLLPPRADDAHVDLGTIIIDGPPRLRLLAADGEPLAAVVGFVRTGWNEVRDTPPSLALDSDGGWRGPDPMAGDAMVIAGGRPEETAAGANHVVDLRVRFPLTGEGPWTLQMPAGEVLLEVTSKTEQGAFAAVFVGDEVVRLDGVTLLRRVPPGPHRLFVTANHHQTAIVEVIVPPTGRAVVKLELPPR